MVNCSGSSTGALNEDVDLVSGRVRPTGGLGAGGGGALGLGTAIARGGDAPPRTSGVSDGFDEFFFFGVGDFSPVFFFFFFDLGNVSLAGDFFDFAFGVASGVSLGVGDASEVGPIHAQIRQRRERGRRTALLASAKAISFSYAAKFLVSA